MKVELKKDGDCRVKLAITAEPAETRKTYEACVGAFIRQATIKGFRPGKAPRAIIEQRFGSDINRETRQRLVGELASKAAKEQNLDVASFVTVENDLFSPETGISFTLTVDLRPEFKLPKYDALKVKANPVEVTEDQVDERLLTFRKHLGGFEDAAPDYALGEDDMVSLDFQAKAKGLDPETLPPEAKRLVEGKDFWMNLAYGEPVPGFAKELLAKKAGETAEFTIAVPKDFPVEALAGKKLSYQATIKAIRAKKLADEATLVQRMGATSLDEAKKHLTEAMKQEAQRQEDNRVRQEICDALLKKADFPLPQSQVDQSVDQELETVLNNYRELPREELEKHREEILKNVRENVVKSLRLHYILLGVANAEKLEVSEDEVKNQVIAIAQRAEMKPADLYIKLLRNGRLESLKEDLKAQKAMEKLMAATRPAESDK
ncbi:MAG: trigger factor [Kiritimatiellia bacterium]|nr:trigger factor [Kiritimatiellia bacterium]